jgi:hypothetical protein
MDTSQLVIGQKSWMQSGDLFKEATVTEITDKYVAVKPVSFEQNERPWMIQFQKDGTQFVKRTKDEVIGELGVYEWYEAEGFTGWWREDPRPLCGSGGEPFELVER